jgi:hypothetical protein
MDKVGKMGNGSSFWKQKQGKRKSRESMADETPFKELSDHILAEMNAWNASHPQATFLQIEEKARELVSQLEAHLIQASALEREPEDWSHKPESERPTCPVCQTPLLSRGKRVRHVQGPAGRDIELQRTYGTCPQCGTGFFPLDVHAGEKSSLEGWVEYDELANEQWVEWHMPLFDQERLAIHISYPRDPRLAQGAFTLATTTQIWSVFLHLKIAELTIVDEVLTIHLELQNEQEEPLLVATAFQDGTAAVTLTMTPQSVERLADATSEGTIELFLKSIGEVLMDMALDPSEEIVALFDPDAHGEAIYRLSAVAHPAYLWRKNAFAKSVVGVDDAS